MGILALYRKSNDPNAWQTIIGFSEGLRGVVTVADALERGVKIVPRSVLSREEWRRLTLEYLNAGIRDYGEMLHYVIDGRVVRYPEARSIVASGGPLGDEIMRRYGRLVDQLVNEIGKEIGASCEGGMSSPQS